MALILTSPSRMVPAFDVTGGELGLFPNALQDWHNKFQIGDVADSGSTLLLAFVAVVLLFTLDAAMRRMRLGDEFAIAVSAPASLNGRNQSSVRLKIK